MNKTAPKMCINSLTRVNLHPLTRIKFSDSTERINGFLIAGYIFKNFNSQPTALEKFAFLPQFWWGVSPKYIQTAVDIVGKYGGDAYELVCIDEIHDTLLIPYADMDQLRVCVVVAEEH